MLKKILILFVLLIGLFALFIATRPSQFQIERNILIAAPADKIFPLINDFHSHKLWSPWEKLDLSMKKSFAGSPAGVGSIYSWEGNEKVGAGRMTITDSQPNKKVSMDLDYLKPFKAASKVDFVLTPSSGGTIVSWSMSGHKQFMQKIFCSFINMDKMVGGEFETGLRQLKTVIESNSFKTKQ